MGLPPRPANKNDAARPLAFTPLPEPVNLTLLSAKLSIDNALRSWTSMTISMISFGFAIYKILQQDRVEGAVVPGANTPRNVGLFLVVAGTIGILMGIGSYVRSLRRLRTLQHFSFLQPTLIMALMMAFLGLSICGGVAIRLL